MDASTADNPKRAQDSCRRRLRFAGTSRFFFDTLFGHPAFGRLFTHPAVQYAPRVPDVLVNYCSDAIECFRQRRIVPDFGDARPGVAMLSGLFDQHPRYRDYWYDASRKALVGLHVGVDLIRVGDLFYILEMNLDAAMRPARRQLYNVSCDPDIMRIAQAAVQHDFQHVVFCNRRWSQQYRDEIREAGIITGLETVAAASPHQDRESLPLPGLPDPLEPQTLYVFFHGRHTGLDYYIDNKKVSTVWVSQELNEAGSSDHSLRIPETSDTVFIPENSPPPEFPNLVVKLAGSGRGQDVLMGRFESVEQVQNELGISEQYEVPVQFRSTIRQRIEHRIFSAGEPLFQQFVPPQVDSNGHAYIYRLHALITPLFDHFLSVHKVVSRQSIPTKPLTTGLARDPGRFVVNFSHGAEYQSVHPDEAQKFEVLTKHLGEFIRNGLRRKFHIGPQQ